MQGTYSCNGGHGESIRKTWAMVRQGRVVRSRTDYIMGYDCRIFQNVAVRDLRHNSNHLMVMECLYGASPMEHSRYLR